MSNLGVPIIKLTDMDEEMQQYTIKMGMHFLDLESDKDVASAMKACFEKQFKGNWHCIIGRNFGGFVTHEQKKYIYFYIG